MAQIAEKQKTLDQLDDEILLLRREEKRILARDSLLDFIEYTMPDPEYPEDVRRSSYQVKPHHRLLAAALERVERGECLRLAISIAPQHGKSEEASRRFPAWFIGRNPHKNIMFGTYSDTFAEEFGGDVRTIMQSPAYGQVFPLVELAKGSKAKNFLRTTKGGRAAFIGRGGAGTGKPADLFLIDDPLKNAEEAESAATIRQLHGWFTKVAFTRCHVGSAIVIIHTRWTEDDLIGRMCDPDHPHYDPEIAENWTYINIPAVITEQDLADALGYLLEVPEDPKIIKQFGVKPMCALWPERFPLIHLAEAKRLNPRGFEALYQGRPAPEDGEYFTREMLVEEFEPNNYPDKSDLRMYAASDHALTKNEDNDMTCLGAFGVDDKDDIWIMPTIVWDRFQTDVLVDEMIAVMHADEPLIWFAEDEHIRKSIAPFLRKRMDEESVYTLVKSMPSTVDLKSRARAIQGRMAMKKVHFPAWMPWWHTAKMQLLKFPYAVHDDFISFLSLIGRGMLSEIKAENKLKKKQRLQESGKVVEVGSLAWIKAEHNARARREKMAKSAAGF